MYKVKEFEGFYRVVFVNGCTHDFVAVGAIRFKWLHEAEIYELALNFGFTEDFPTIDVYYVDRQQVA